MGFYWDFFAFPLLLASVASHKTIQFLAGLLLIMTVSVAGQMLSSKVEYMSARLYNSPIIVSGSKVRTE